MDKVEILNLINDLREDIQRLKFENYQTMNSGCDMERRISLIESKEEEK